MLGNNFAGGETPYGNKRDGGFVNPGIGGLSLGASYLNKDAANYEAKMNQIRLQGQLQQQLAQQQQGYNMDLARLRAEEDRMARQQQYANNDYMSSKNNMYQYGWY